MRKISIAVIVTALVLIAAGFKGPGVGAARASECQSNEKIDKSSADTARQKMEKAGFHRVRELSKGCDNFWHGVADKDGVVVNVVLTPQGHVMVEGN